MAKAKEKKKAKPRGRPFQPNDPETGKKDERINRDGAPQRGASYKELYDYYDELTADETAAMLPAGQLKQAYQQFPKKIAMKHLKVIRVNAAIMFEPTAGLLKETSDRTDGKVPDEINNRTTLTITNLEEILNKVYGKRSNRSK